MRWQATDHSEDDLQKRLLVQAANTLATEEALVADAGFDLADLLATGVWFVARLKKNATAHRHVLPDYKGKGRKRAYGQLVRPLPRSYNGKQIEATAPDATESWTVGGSTLCTQIWDNLVASDAKPGAASFRGIAIQDPRCPPLAVSDQPFGPGRDGVASVS